MLTSFGPIWLDVSPLSGFVALQQMWPNVWYELCVNMHTDIYQMEFLRKWKFSLFLSGGYCDVIWIFLPSPCRINVLELWTSSSPSLGRCCWRLTWHPEDWIFLMSTASSTMTFPLTLRYRGADNHVGGAFDDLFHFTDELICGCVWSYRTIFTGLAEQPEQDDLENPSLSSLSKKGLFIVTSHSIYNNISALFPLIAIFIPFWHGWVSYAILWFGEEGHCSK